MWQNGDDFDTVSCKRLVGAILIRALKDLTHSNQKIRESAVEFFKDESECPFTFVWCVEYVDLKPNQVTKKLNEMNVLNLNHVPIVKSLDIFNFI